MGTRQQSSSYSLGVHLEPLGGENVIPVFHCACPEQCINSEKIPVKAISPSDVIKHLNTEIFRDSEDKVKYETKEKEVEAVKSMQAQSTISGIGKVRCAFLQP